MNITVNIESPVSPEALKLIQGSEAALRSVYTEDECFTFNAEELLAQNIRFFVARKDNTALGCVALVNCGDYGEIKRLFVDPEARGLGLARILMDHLEKNASAQGLNHMKLETGKKLAAAVHLYKSLGYSVCGRFGDYEDHPASLFMEKAL